MKSNLVHVCFVLDESGSMSQSTKDVIGGFKSVIDKQKEVKDGECLVSLYKFSTKAEKLFIGKNVNDVEYLEVGSFCAENDASHYFPHGLTAMNDGIGMAIDDIGEWIDKMKEEDKPEKNIIVVMTDGYENNSKDYTLDRVREMIKHQEEKYSWEFVYMGTDITSTEQATSLGFSSLNSAYSTRDNLTANYDAVNTYLSCYRCTDGDFQFKSMKASAALQKNIKEMNDEYEESTGIKLENK